MNTYNNFAFIVYYNSICKRQAFFSFFNLTYVKILFGNRVCWKLLKTFLGKIVIE